MLLRLASSLITLNSRGLPSRCEVSRRGRTSTSEPGRKARIVLMSTVKPPLTLPLMTPVITSSASNAASSAVQASIRRAFSRDNLVSPKPSSTASSATCTMSPMATVNSPCSSINSIRGITPSDLRPACTVTQSLSMSSTTPVIIAPGCISIVFKLSSNKSANDSTMTVTFCFNASL